MGRVHCALHACSAKLTPTGYQGDCIADPVSPDPGL
jgi:hypothetical protein